MRDLNGLDCPLLLTGRATSVAAPTLGIGFWRGGDDHGLVDDIELPRFSSTPYSSPLLRTLTTRYVTSAAAQRRDLPPEAAHRRNTSWDRPTENSPFAGAMEAAGIEPAKRSPRHRGWWCLERRSSLAQTAGTDAPEAGALPARIQVRPYVTSFTAQEHVERERAELRGARASNTLPESA
jgi:hypothetical protein